jgi:hypothetical protein
MNKGELRTAVKNVLAIPSAGDGLITDSIVDLAIAQALNVLCTTRDWPWLMASQQIAFPANVGYAELPCDFVRAKELLIDDHPIPFVDLNQFLDPSEATYSYMWTIVGSQVKVKPTPTTLTLATMYYYKAEPELQADTSEPLIPSFLQQWVIAYASYLCAMRRQDERTAQVYLAQSNDLLLRMRDDVRQKTGRRIQVNRRLDYANWR